MVEWYSARDSYFIKGVLITLFIHFLICKRGTKNFHLRVLLNAWNNSTDKTEYALSPFFEIISDMLFLRRYFFQFTQQSWKENINFLAHFCAHFLIKLSLFTVVLMHSGPLVCHLPVRLQEKIHHCWSGHINLYGFIL